MKYLHFLRWQWNKFSISEKLFWIGVMLLFLGIAAGSMNIPWLGPLTIYVSFALIGGIFVKWFLVDMLVQAYKQYKDEQQKIVDVMKYKNNKDVL
jgi:hypothetical protein